MSQIHVAGFPGDVGGDKVAGVIGADGACLKLLNVHSEVRKDLVQLIPRNVGCVSFWDHALEASCTKSALHVRPLFVEVSSDYDLALM